MPLHVTADHQTAFRKDLLDWYVATHRDLPWRQTADPYRIWLSEVMLQQTRVDQATPYYHRFTERFPSVESLAGADLDEVLLCWEGLGYYSRARKLHEAARMVVKEFDGRIPDSEPEIRALPGVGPYTAAAVLSIAYDKPHAVLDGNVARVLARVFAVESEIDKAPARRALSEAAGLLLDRERPGVFNQAVMELGATICAPTLPQCTSCPVRPVCAAYTRGEPTAYPVTTKRRAVPHYDIAVALLFDEGGRLLIQRRPEESMLGGLWEFPGGKRERGERLEETCRRELREELCVEISIDGLFARVSHAYSHFRITLYAYRARIVEGTPRSSRDLPVQWVDVCDLGRFAFPRANRRIIEHLASK
ncbi:MAG: A/G-specific adenine glycosylase [Rhodothermales bacterium]